MYTERAPGGINNLCMNDHNTTQELSILEKQRQANRLSYQRNKEKRKKACLDNHYKNHEKCVHSMRKYRKDNKERIKASCREYYQLNKERRQQYARSYIALNKEKIKETNRIYSKRKRISDPYYRLVSNIRTRMYGAIKQQLAGKSKPTFKLLGCTVKEFTVYISKKFEPGMTWENYSKDSWHIDHIKPCNTFDLTDPEQQKECFHYSNLRPLWSKENLSRPKDGSDLPVPLNLYILEE
jgi:hypothetical protein